MTAAIRRGWNVAAMFALVAAVSSCGEEQTSGSSAPSRRPITEEEFYEYVVGHTIFRSSSGGYVDIAGDPPAISGFDGCNWFAGPLVFSDGEVVFPEGGLQGTERGCPGVETGSGGGPFGMWMVEPDGSIVLIAALDGSEHVVLDISVPNP